MTQVKDIVTQSKKQLLVNFLMLLFPLFSFGQTYEYVYKNQNDSSYNCYLKIIPKSQQIRGLVIRDFSFLPDVTKPSPHQFSALCSEVGIMTIYTVSSNYFPELFIFDSVFQS